MTLQTFSNLLRLYAITADGAAVDPKAKARVRQWLEGGVRVVQLREKNLPAADIVAFGRYLRAITSEYGALFLVNDDPHLADLLEADGCHLGREDMNLTEARKIMGGRIIGVSTHSREQAFEAARMKADYIGVGPIFPTATKKVAHPVTGPELAGWAAGTLDLPVVAIGGITLGNVAQVVSAGCSNVAVISALNRAERTAEVVRSFLEILSAPHSANLP